MQTKEDVLEFFELALHECVGHPHEHELVELLVSQVSDEYNLILNYDAYTSTN